MGRGSRRGEVRSGNDRDDRDKLWAENENSFCDDIIIHRTCTATHHFTIHTVNILNTRGNHSTHVRHLQLHPTSSTKDSSDIHPPLTTTWNHGARRSYILHYIQYTHIRLASDHNLPCRHGVDDTLPAKPRKSGRVPRRIVLIGLHQPFQ